ELVAAAEDADRQHPRGVDQFARHVHRHVADRLAARRGGFPLLDRVEVKVLEERLAAIDDRFDGRGSSHQQCSHSGLRFARNATRPSLASRVFMSRARYSCSTSARRLRTSRSIAPRAAVRAGARLAALLPARGGSNQGRAGAPRASGPRRTRPDARASSASIERPENSRSSAAGWLIRYGSNTDAAGANTPSFISGCPNCASRAAKIGPPASATSRPPPRHWPRTATRIGAGKPS